MEPNIRFKKNLEEKVVDKGRFQRLVGRLIYLSRTRPDVAFIVSLVCQFMHNQIEEHMQVVRKILSYLKGHTR